MKKITLLSICLSMVIAISAQAEALRVSHLTPEIWAKFKSGEITELLVEFQQGDSIPVTIRPEGDLLETTQVNPSYVTVKKDFFVKFNQKDVYMSLDNVTYKPFKDFMRGNLSVGVSAGHSGGVANAIEVIFNSFLK